MHKMVEHHHPPKSRGGGKTVELPKTFHEAFHTVFQDLKGRELITFLVRLHQMMDRQDKITSKQIHVLRQEVIED